MNRPKPNKYFERRHFEQLEELCELMIDERESGTEDTDTKHYIYEEVLNLIYGKEIWNYFKYLRNLPVPEPEYIFVTPGQPPIKPPTIIPSTPFPNPMEVTCNKCGVSFGPVSMYSCPNNDCPIQSKPTM